MKTILAILLAVSLAGCGTLRQTAHEAIAADALTTGAGLLIGAGTEVNPLITSIPMGLATVGARIAAVEIANRQDEPTRTNALAATNAITWGVVANNLYVLAAKFVPMLAMGHASFIVGIGAGWLVWSETADDRLKAEFMAMCNHERKTNPKLVCAYGNRG